jgi:hypothetical protein
LTIPATFVSITARAGCAAFSFGFAMMKRFALLVSIAQLLALHCSQVHAQSFNCHYAKTADEVLICQDHQLSALDERMAGIYSQVRQNLYGSQRIILESQQATFSVLKFLLPLRVETLSTQNELAICQRV